MPGSRCQVYLDDIISFGSTFSDALDNLTLIFEKLRSYGLQLKSTKCHLFQTSVPFLGHIVGRRGLECDPAKIEDVKSWSVPDCLKSVRQFLGFVGYYRRFIPNFADISTPMVALTYHLFGIRSVRQLSTLCTIRSSMHLFWLFRRKPDSTSWTLMPVTLGWVLFDPHSDVVAPLNERCWLLWLCVSSSGRIYVALSSLSVRITSHWYGYIGLRTRRV